MTILNGRISLKSSQYPKLLREVFNPPKELFFRGNFDLINKACISIVGTRKSTDYGKFAVKTILDDLSGFDICTVSGLALGIDTYVHEISLENDIPTIAVLGSGLNNIYPPENIKLAEKIAEKGLLLSEFEEDIEPKNFHFPMRNRIISGLSCATIVVEAREKSGALITAKLALDQGREIFVVPGDIDRETSRGTIRLLQSCAAYPILSGHDVIDVLRKQSLFKGSVNEEGRKKINKMPEINLFKLDKDEEKVLDVLSKNKSKIFEDIQIALGMDVSELMAILSILEIKGYIEIKDNKYRRLL